VRRPTHGQWKKRFHSRSYLPIGAKASTLAYKQKQRQGSHDEVPRSPPPSKKCLDCGQPSEDAFCGSCLDN